MSLTAVRQAGWQRVGRLDEDWELVLLGAVAVMLTVGLGLLVLAGAQGRDTRLADAAATEQRLALTGLDDNLTQHLIKLQNDEVLLYTDQVDSAGLEDKPTADNDPRLATDKVQADLTAVTEQLDGSTRVRTDVDMIREELGVYTGLEATAMADNQQGLPIGAAYLREASGYLHNDMLPRAADISAVDQARLAGDDADAAGVPVALVVAAVLVLAYLLAAQVVLARRTRRRLNPGLAAATALAVVLIAWSLTATLLERGQVATGATPRALAAADLTRVRADAMQVDLDDRLTQADHGEDCLTTSANAALVTCIYEQDALTYLATSDGRRPGGLLSADLATAAHDSPDPSVRRDLAAATARTKALFLGEKALPTLQNLSVSSASYGSNARNSQDYVSGLLPRYTSDATPYFAAVATADGSIDDAAQKAGSAEWGDYAGQVADAGDTLGGLASGGLLLGLLAGAAAGTGVGWRVAEYWSGGGSGV